MRGVFLGVLGAVSLLSASGCRTCGDRPRLIDRLFHRDDDSPSRSTRSAADGACGDQASRRPCNDLMGSPMVPVGYGQPMYGTPIAGGFASSTFPAGGFSNPARDDVLPPPSTPRLPSPNVPEASPLPAIPGNGLNSLGNGVRSTGDTRK